MKNLFKKSFSYILCVMLFAAMTLAIGCGKSNDATTLDKADVTKTIEGCELGSGDTQFTFVVVDKEAKETTFTVNTNETTVGAALLSVNLIAGDDSEYGLYVKTVNGITVDWDVDQKYWAFYIDGEYAMTGVDSTEIKAGSTYTFKVE